MYLYCDRCGYDSGDFDELDDLANKVWDDGGRVNIVRDRDGLRTGTVFTCPNGCRDEDLHLD